MKFRYLIVDLIDGSVVGTNNELTQHELDDDYYTVIDLAAFQAYNPTLGIWEAMEAAINGKDHKDAAAANVAEEEAP